MPSEKAVLNAGLIEASACAQTLCWRNPTGFGWVGRRLPTAIGSRVVIEPRMIVLCEATAIRFGLVGSADVLGVTAGRAWAAEFKTTIGVQAQEQSRFQRAFEAAGGVYELVRTAAAAGDLPRRLLAAHG